jgi:(p)ppGpp synthase/HD superfamily hydrolase
MTLFITHEPSDSMIVEQAIIFLVDAINKSGHNPKPVILHSIRVGLFLFNQKYSQDIAVAAILHDIIEDTDINIESIEKQFGSKVAELIAANTINKEITNKFERDIEMLNRCKKEGKEALLIKATEIVDNSYYYYFCENEAQFHRLMEKMSYFIKIASEELSEEPIWNLLTERYKELSSNNMPK